VKWLLTKKGLQERESIDMEAAAKRISLSEASGTEEACCLTLRAAFHVMLRQGRKGVVMERWPPSPA